MKISCACLTVVVMAAALQVRPSAGFTTRSATRTTTTTTSFGGVITSLNERNSNSNSNRNRNDNKSSDNDDESTQPQPQLQLQLQPQPQNKWKSTFAAVTLGLVLSTSGMFGGGTTAAFAAAATEAGGTYDGFAEYAKDNQMEKSDVGCFVDKCGDQTKNLFSNPRGIKGITCLGRCKGEQACAIRCFAEYGSEDLNQWLSCTIEENECVKVPKNLDTSAETVGYTTTVQKFDPSHLEGTWYKTDGLNPNYDLFDCQTNTFKATTADKSELDMGIFLRVQRPEEAGGGYWENALMEHMVVDALQRPGQPPAAGSRTMHTEGKMNGLTFDENWYILGESDGKGAVPAFVLVAYKGHTLQGGYEGSFVYSREPVLSAAAVPAVKEAAEKAGLNWADYSRIDNTCPVGKPLNDVEAGTGTSTADWIDLVVGEGGVIDWISPGWRGEYKK